MSEATQNTPITPAALGPDRSAAKTFDETFEDMAPEDEHEHEHGSWEAEPDKGSLVSQEEAPPSVPPEIEHPITEQPAPISDSASVSPEINSDSAPEGGVLTENTTPEGDDVQASSGNPGHEAPATTTEELAPPIGSDLSTQESDDLTHESPLPPSGEVGVLTENTADVSSRTNSLPTEIGEEAPAWVWKQPENSAPASAPTREVSADLESAFVGEDPSDDVPSQTDHAPSIPQFDSGQHASATDPATQPENPSPDQILVQFFVETHTGEMSSDSVSYNRNPQGFYDIDPGDSQRDEVQGYVKKGKIPDRLVVKSPSGDFVFVQAGHPSIVAFLTEQSDYYNRDEMERRALPWPPVDPLLSGVERTIAGSQTEFTHDSYAHSGPSTVVKPSAAAESRPTRQPTQGDRLIAALELSLASHRSNVVKTITTSEKARFLDIRHADRKEISKRAGVRLGLFGQAKRAATAALRSPSKESSSSLADNALISSQRNGREISNVRHITHAVSPALRNAILSYESTATTLQKGIEALNTTVSHHPKFNELNIAVCECMAEISQSRAGLVSPEMVIMAANDSSIRTPSLEKVRKKAGEILESSQDLMLISTSTNLLAQQLSRHAQEIGNGIIGLKQSGLPEGKLREIEAALGTFHDSVSQVPTPITPNAGTGLIRETLSYMAEITSPAVNVDHRPSILMNAPAELSNHHEEPTAPSP